MAVLFSKTMVKCFRAVRIEGEFELALSCLLHLSSGWSYWSPGNRLSIPGLASVHHQLLIPISAQPFQRASASNYCVYSLCFLRSNCSEHTRNKNKTNRPPSLKRHSIRFYASSRGKHIMMFHRGGCNEKHLFS